MYGGLNVFEGLLLHPSDFWLAGVAPVQTVAHVHLLCLSVDLWVKLTKLMITLRP